MMQGQQTDYTLWVFIVLMLALILFRLFKKREKYPCPCVLCGVDIEDENDLDWHGFGNCVEIPEEYFSIKEK